MKTKDNPFYILGFNPDLLRGLEDEQILNLIKSQYRGLQIIYHPDRTGGSDEKSKQIGAAYSALGSIESVQKYKKEFLRKIHLNQKISELEESLNEERLRRYQVVEKLAEYLQSFSDSHENSVFNIGPCVLKMQDYASGLRVSTFMRSVKRKGVGSLWYDLIVRKNGTLLKRKNRKTIASLDKTLVGVVDDKTSALNGGFKNVLRLSQKIWTPEDEHLRRKLLGTNAPSYPRQISEFENQISMGGFQEIMMLLTPRISEYSLLFALNNPRDREPYFSVEGIVIKIRKK